MRFYELALGILAVWRVTNLLNAEHGPWNLLGRLRQRVVRTFWEEVLECFYCLSIWISAPCAALLGNGLKDSVLLWLALSAGAILLERFSSRPAPATFFEEEFKQDEFKEDEDVQLPQSDPSIPAFAAQGGRGIEYR
jgi:hypothetical protein